MDNTIPQRKSTRLKYFDYSTTGAYFITICTRDRMKILSEITREDLTSTNITNDLQPVGEGLAPPAKRPIECSPTALNFHQDTPCAVGEGLAPPAKHPIECSPTTLNSHQDTPCAVGEVPAPPAKRSIECSPTALNSHQDTPCAVGEVLAPPATKLSKIGELVEEQMSDLEERYKTF